MMGKAQLKVEVSEAVELMSILSRTAGFEEYSKDLAGQYTKDTEEWFPAKCLTQYLNNEANRLQNALR